MYTEIVPGKIRGIGGGDTRTVTGDNWQRIARFMRTNFLIGIRKRKLRSRASTLPRDRRLILFGDLREEVEVKRTGNQE